MKQYVKPDLYYENFELSQHIAACGIDVNYGSENECQPSLDPSFWHGANDTVFNSAPECAVLAGGLGVYCYTSGTNEAGRLFNS